MQHKKSTPLEGITYKLETFKLNADKQPDAEQPTTVRLKPLGQFLIMVTFGLLTYYILHSLKLIIF